MSLGGKPTVSSLPPAAQEWIKELQLEPHPEGGFYREVSRGNWITANPCGEHRYAYTTIYFLLTAQSPSHLHRLQADEVWFHHAGDPIDIHCIYRTPQDEEHCCVNPLLPRQDPSSLPLHTEYIPPTPALTSSAGPHGKKETSDRKEVEAAALLRDMEHHPCTSGTDTKLYEKYKCVTLGYRRKERETSFPACPPTILQFTVPRLAIFGSSISRYAYNHPPDGYEHFEAVAAKPQPVHGFTLVSCMVAPGFDFKDFEVFTQAQLLSICPHHEAIIRELAYETLPSSSAA